MTTGYVYGTDVLPDAKTDAHPLVGPPSKNVTASDWNKHRQALLDAIAAILAMSPSGGTNHGGEQLLATDGEQLLSGLKNTFVGVRGMYFGPGYKVFDPGDGSVTVDVGSFTGAEPLSTFEPDPALLTGDVLNTATPSITCNGGTVQPGQEMTFINRHPTNKYTLQDKGTLVGSGLRLTSTTIDLVNGASVCVRYFADDNLWYEMRRSVPV